MARVGGRGDGEEGVTGGQPTGVRGKGNDGGMHLTFGVKSGPLAFPLRPNCSIVCLLRTASTTCAVNLSLVPELVGKKIEIWCLIFSFF